MDYDSSDRIKQILRGKIAMGAGEMDDLAMAIGQGKRSCGGVAKKKRSGSKSSKKKSGSKTMKKKKSGSKRSTNPWFKFLAAFRRDNKKKYKDQKKLVKDAAKLYRQVKKGKKGGVLVGGARKGKGKKPKGALAALLSGLNAKLEVD